MKQFQSSPAARVFFLIVSANIWLGIWLTGFGVAHWWLYIPGGFLLFAAITGFCPGMIITRTLFSEKSAV
ncbi:MAG: DUF2892 domain-containing protein [Thiobacillus sp.]|nr:DUF2892 domain-containing protein [Thiobacillus sp.]